MKDCVNRKKNADACACPNKECERRGACCECVRAHRESNSLPMCLRSIAEGSRKK